jgi:AAA family ATP:ADP antiporter
MSENPWEKTLILLTVVVLFCGFMIMGVYRYLNNKLLDRQEKLESAGTPKEEKKKVHMSMRENFSLLGKSKYLLYIAIIVLSYNLVINLIEVIWKDQVKQLYPLPNDYNAYMSQVNSLTGLISMFTALFISGHLIRKCGWTFTALIPPIILCITSIGFFFFFFGRNDLLGMITYFGTSPLALVVFFGSAQNCLSRAAKFALFDATKEMAFVPLDSEMKLKGKAVIDGVGSRLGKSGGSLIHQGLILIFSTISASAHIVAVLLFGAIAFWVGAVLSLGKHFNALIHRLNLNGANGAPSATAAVADVKAPEEEPALSAK